MTLFPFPNAQMFASFLSAPSLMEISASTALLKWNGSGDCASESVCWLFWLSHSLHLSRRPISLICLRQTRCLLSVFIVRTGRCNFGWRSPPAPDNILGSSGNFPLGWSPRLGHCGAQWPVSDCQLRQMLLTSGTFSLVEFWNWEKAT